MHLLSNSRYARYVVQLLGLLFIAGSLSGCAGLGKGLESPKVNLANITVQEIKPFEAVFGLQLRVFNMNDVPLAIKALDCELEVNGRHLATGVTETEASIPALGTGLVHVTVYASSLQLVTRLLDVLRTSGSDGKSESIAYDLSGRLHLNEQALPAEIPFSAEGTMSMDRFIDPQGKAS